MELAMKGDYRVVYNENQDKFKVLKRVHKSTIYSDIHYRNLDSLGEAMRVMRTIALDSKTDSTWRTVWEI